MRLTELIKRRILPVLLLAIFVSMAVPFSSCAEESVQKVVRVGWFDSSFYYWDQAGRRCGIAYEYEHKISAYTGWTYEYVDDSWPNLFQMLKEGKIDILSDVSFRPERAEVMSFPDLPMGSESYYIYIDAQNRDLTAANPLSFTGTRIGVNQGSVQEGFLKEWAEKNGVTLEVVPLDLDEDESMDMVTRGEIDGYASIYSFSSKQKVVPVCRIGSSEYYFAVNKSRPDLLAELNMALAGIQDEDPYFNQRLNDERLYNTRTNAFLKPNQEGWIQQHGVIRVGYRENYLPYSQKDKETNELTGALKDYLARAENNLRSSNVQFHAIAYASTQEAIEALKACEIDCFFPIYLSSYDSDQMGVRLTNPAMKTAMSAIMRSSDSLDLSRDSRLTFAVPSGELNIQTFIMDKYPLCSCAAYENEEACYQAVASGKADCALVSNYRNQASEEITTKYRLLTVPVGESMPLSFAVNKTERDLYFLLNKTTLMTDSGDMDSALASYMQINRKVSFTDFLKDNWIWVVGILTVLFFLIVSLLLQSLKTARKLNEQQKMIEEGLRRELQQKEKIQSAMDMAYRDPLTGVKSKHAYNEATENMNRRISEGAVSEFGVVVFDLNDLKTINDHFGHEIGDKYIRDACKLICTCFKHSPVYRIGGDEFTAILEGEDYDNRDELLEKFEKQVLANLEKKGSVVSFGCSAFDPRKDSGIGSVFDRADVKMYKEKELLKSLGASTNRDQPEKTENDYSFEDISVINVRKHILIADDVEINREILGDLLEDEYDIYYAADGAEALEMLRSHKEEIALVILDLYMPNMTGREVMMQMQVDEDLMMIPVIFISVDLSAELDCLKIGAMDFISKPYPGIEIVKARIARCIELAENRELIRQTQRDKLTGLFNVDYFIRYVARFDQHYEGVAFDAIACVIQDFSSMNEKYGRQFGNLVLRSIGIGISKLTRKIGGIGCRKGEDTFLIYCPHRNDFSEQLEKVTADLFVEKETADKVTLKFGVLADAQKEPDIEERFVRATAVADEVKNDPNKMIGIYEFDAFPGENAE